jgi:hypothetical protein
MAALLTRIQSTRLHATMIEVCRTSREICRDECYLARVNCRVTGSERRIRQLALTRAVTAGIAPRWSDG